MRKFNYFAKSQLNDSFRFPSPSIIVNFKTYKFNFVKSMFLYSSSAKPLFANDYKTIAIARQIFLSALDISPLGTAAISACLLRRSTNFNIAGILCSPYIFATRFFASDLSIPAAVIYNGF